PTMYSTAVVRSRWTWASNGSTRSTASRTWLTRWYSFASSIWVRTCTTPRVTANRAGTNRTVASLVGSDQLRHWNSVSRIRPNLPALTSALLARPRCRAGDSRCGPFPATKALVYGACVLIPQSSSGFVWSEVQRVGHHPETVLLRGCPP